MFLQMEGLRRLEPPTAKSEHNTPVMFSFARAGVVFQIDVANEGRIPVV